MKARDDAELQRVFSKIPRPWAFRGVWIQITDMTTVPSNMFKGIQVQNFHLEVNRIHTVRPNAFDGSEQSAMTISVFGNDLTDFPYAELKKFIYLRTFNIARNKISRIPSSAFQGFKSLTTILLAENMIDSIGENAFYDLPNLERLDLLHNRITILGPLSLAMNGHSPGLNINLANNSLASVSQSALQGTAPKVLSLALNRLQYLDQSVFVPLIQRMSKVAGVIDVSFNPFLCRGCEFLWMVVNKDVLRFALPGFRCTDGRTVMDLNRMNIFC